MAKVKQSAFDRLRMGARLNRKERRVVEQRLTAADPALEIVNRDAAGTSAPTLFVVDEVPEVLTNEIRREC